ncbi:MAG: malto-oligosyltrehalose trehalohydrolase, partial [Planctomycetota bacterium]
MVLHRAAVGDRPLHVLPVGPQRQEDGSVVWRVWAPLCDHVELVLGGDEPSHAVRMSRGDRGYHEHRQANVDEGARYCFRLPDGGQYPDPMSLWQPDGVHRPSAVFFPERYEWHDGEWRGIDLVDTVLYEIHIGTFTPEGT